ncbi:HalOD1 output domain-containing protein [Halomarina litorea]|uniref:HalOD1 output domain-containing protein n=1 Tax=Halomarina litorea TaxID=2961595 RepID=UPI0020C2EB29|nr:HalOD1 output domain-containing protein [Halomarina sp. BCD28]
MGLNDDGVPSETDGRSPIRSEEFRPGATDPLHVVTDLLASELESSPLELNPPLGRVVDWDAVVTLLGRSGETGTVEFVRFTYGDYEVEIRGSGSVFLFQNSE